MRKVLCYYINKMSISFSFHCCLLLFVLISLTTNAQILGGYKYVHICGICESIRDYKWINSLENVLSERGCSVIQPYVINTMDYEKRSSILFVDFNTVQWYASFYDYYTGSHICEIPVGDPSGKKFIRALSKALDCWDNTFNTNLSKTTVLPYSSWTEDKIKDYMSEKTISSLEGIYKKYESESDGSERIAIFNYSGSFYAITLDYIKDLYHYESLYKGDVRMVLNKVEDNVYDVKFFSRKAGPNSTFDLLAEHKDRILSLHSKGKNYKYIKVYPQSSSTTDQVKTAPTTQIKSTGSGFVVSDYIIATNYHVVKDASSIQVTFNVNGKMKDYNAIVISTDKTNDLALLSIKDSHFRPFKSIPYSILSRSIDVGSSVFTMGYPMTDVLGNEVKVTDGLISSKTGYEGDIVTYQISAPIQPGNSGGALFDKKGHLVGVTNAGISSGDNIGYAIKSSYLINLIDSAPINIPLPKGLNLTGKDLPSIIKLYSPYIAIIKVY